jgi:ribonuclease III
MKIPYQFQNDLLLKQALTHPSFVKSNKNLHSHYERLEFLGDSILSMVIAEILYKERIQDDEGNLSIMHSNLINAQSIAKVANMIDLGSLLIMDNGEEISGGRFNERNLENAMEALIAAVYLDSDYETVRAFIKGLWYPLLNDKTILEKDKKSLLQEWAQSHNAGLPSYHLVNRIGKPHESVFTIEVVIKDHNGIGVGRSKKEAEHKAAEDCLNKIQISNLWTKKH